MSLSLVTIFSAFQRNTSDAMATKKGAPTNEELLAQFDELDDAAKDERPRKSTPSNAKAAPRNEGPGAVDPMADLSNLVQDRPKSRPGTPRAAPAPSSPKRGSTPTPAAAVQARKSGESTRSFHQSFRPADAASDALDDPAKKDAPEADASASSGGWWGGIMATASAAVKQAENLAKEIQKNEEAQRWAEQVKGNVGALRSYGIPSGPALSLPTSASRRNANSLGVGGELRSRALPTFTQILQTIAPPISAHERLQVHTTHDLIGYPSLDPLIHLTFSRVMAQVEGGDLLVIQRGQESSPRKAGGDRGYRGSSSAGWSDGPWWRQMDARRDLGPVRGLVEGTKLCRAGAEGYANEYFADQGGVEAAAKRAAEVLSETNPTRSSDIFLALQAVVHREEDTLFAAGPQPAAADADEKGKQSGSITEPIEEPEELLSFAAYLHDPVHGLAFHATSQALPWRWVKWLDLDPTAQESTTGGDANEASTAALPADIREVVETGGVDPREWVAEWVEETLALLVGVVAQRYVARRMGVGEGGLGRGKGRAEVIEAGAGEAARAM